MSKLDAIIQFCGLLEAELLVTLMLHHWNHPRAADEEYINNLLEAVS